MHQDGAIYLLANPIYLLILCLLIYHQLAIMDWYSQIPNFDSANDASAHPFNGSINDDWVLAGQHDMLQAMQPTTAFPSVPSSAPSGHMIGSREW